MIYDFLYNFFEELLGSLYGTMEVVFVLASAGLLISLAYAFQPQRSGE